MILAAVVIGRWAGPEGLCFGGKHTIWASLLGRLVATQLNNSLRMPIQRAFANGFDELASALDKMD